jgi:hypothetical protein
LTRMWMTSLSKMTAMPRATSTMTIECWRCYLSACTSNVQHNMGPYARSHGKWLSSMHGVGVYQEFWLAFYYRVELQLLHYQMRFGILRHFIRPICCVWSGRSLCHTLIRSNSSR